ncbi:MAG: flagellar basal body rod protein FlgC [Phycisphaerae bacterium]|nr:flagellar basal body rod protein FlgC [Phycisphaerae bacterium]
MFGSLDVSASALTAHRTRLNVIAQNLANQHTTHDAKGNYQPYRRRIPVLASGDPAHGSAAGVHVRDVMLDASAFRKVHVGTGHPDADADGMLNMPNVNPVIEMVNALEASRAYEANITAAEATKGMLNAALSLLT